MKTIVSARDKMVETQTLHNQYQDKELYGSSIYSHLWKKLEVLSDKDDSKNEFCDYHTIFYSDKSRAPIVLGPMSESPRFKGKPFLC